MLLWTITLSGICKIFAIWTTGVPLPRFLHASIVHDARFDSKDSNLSSQRPSMPVKVVRHHCWNPSARISMIANVFVFASHHRSLWIPILVIMYYQCYQDTTYTTLSQTHIPNLPVQQIWVSNGYRLLSSLSTNICPTQLWGHFEGFLILNTFKHHLVQGELSRPLAQVMSAKCMDSMDISNHSPKHVDIPPRTRRIKSSNRGCKACSENSAIVCNKIAGLGLALVTDFTLLSIFMIFRLLVCDI